MLFSGPFWSTSLALLRRPSSSFLSHDPLRQLIGSCSLLPSLLGDAGAVKRLKRFGGDGPRWSGAIPTQDELSISGARPDALLAPVDQEEASGGTFVRGGSSVMQLPESSQLQEPTWRVGNLLMNRLFQSAIFVPFSSPPLALFTGLGFASTHPTHWLP